MRDLRESRERFLADALGGRTHRSVLRVAFFEIAQLAIKLIVLAIADCRRGFFVIASVVLLDLTAEFPDAFARGRLCLRHARMIQARSRRAIVAQSSVA